MGQHEESTVQDWRALLTRMRQELLVLNLTAFDAEPMVREIIATAPTFIDDFYPSLQLRAFLPKNYLAYTQPMKTMSWWQRRRWVRQLFKFKNQLHWVPEFGRHDENEELEAAMDAAVLAHPKLTKREWLTVSILRMDLDNVFNLLDHIDEGSVELEQIHTASNSFMHEAHAVTAHTATAAYERWLPAYQSILAGKF